MTFNQNNQEELSTTELSIKRMAWNAKQIDEHLSSIATSMKELVHEQQATNNTMKAIGKVLQSKQ